MGWANSASVSSPDSSCEDQPQTNRGPLRKAVAQKERTMSEKQIIPIPGLTGVVDVPLSWVVKADNFIFLSGVPPFDYKTGKLVHGDIDLQTRTVLDSMKFALETAGSSLDKVVKTTIYITNSAYFQRVNKIYREYFPKDFPARTFVAMSSWPLEFDIEIEATALA
jgi:2-iminobutanoate/2-iminopropanoate deaminase